ncbi:helix-turn-helix domain-containing protein [Parenemella sanctibonifatiensis]|nr:helix-turn-helix transcriptional regulator [Parenemella sanctibonifatiensis]
MSGEMISMGQRIRAASEAAGASQEEARRAIGVSQPTYSRLEAGTRPVAGDELVALADRFGVRASTIAGLADVEARVCYAARTDVPTSTMAAMRERLFDYLELDAYLTDQGVPAR